MSKNILVIQRCAPYGSSLAREGLDYVLTSAAYDQNISLLFMGDGVFQLTEQQDSSQLGLKNQAKALEVLPLYDIENLYAVQEDLEERQLKESNLTKGIKVIPRSEVHSFMNEQDHVIGF